MSENSLDNLQVESFETEQIFEEPEQVGDDDGGVSDLYSDDDNILQTSPKRAPSIEEQRDSASKGDEFSEDFMNISQTDDQIDVSELHSNNDKIEPQTLQHKVGVSQPLENPEDDLDNGNNCQPLKTIMERERLRRSIGFEHLFEKLDQDGDGVIDIFELHTALIATNTLVPLDVVVHLFSTADKDSDGTLSLEEFTEYLSKYEALVQGSAANRRIAVWKDLLSDIEFWVVILYVVAGILLVIPSYFINIPANHQANFSLAAGMMYLFGTARYIFRYPFVTWAKQKSLEDKLSTFRETLLDVAKKWIIESKGGDDKMNPAIMDESEIFKVYVFEHLFQTHETSANFLKTDLEVMLLADMGNVVSGPLIEYIWSAIDNDSDGTIDPEEFYEFLVTNAEPPSRARQVATIFCGMITDKTWLFSINFLTASTTSFLVNVLRRHGITFSFGRMTTGVFNSWNYIIGTLYFVSASFDGIRDSYNMQQTAKQMISQWVETLDDKSEEDATMMSSKMLIHKFQTNGGLTRSELSRLLENGSIYLPKVEFNRIFDEIDDSNDGLVQRDEILEYTNKQIDNKKMDILIRCVTNFNFWAQSTWFFGSINYLVAAYGVWGTWNYRVSCIYRFFSSSCEMKKHDSFFWHSFRLCINKDWRDAFLCRWSNSYVPQISSSLDRSRLCLFHLLSIEEWK